MGARRLNAVPDSNIKVITFPIPPDPARLSAVGTRRLFPFGVPGHVRPARPGTLLFQPIRPILPRRPRRHPPNRAALLRAPADGRISSRRRKTGGAPLPIPARNPVFGPLTIRGPKWRTYPQTPRQLRLRRSGRPAGRFLFRNRRRGKPKRRPIRARQVPFPAARPPWRKPPRRACRRLLGVPNGARMCRTAVHRRTTPGRKPPPC